MDILAPAKINLFLQIRGKRPDGYHDLCTVMCALNGLADRIVIQPGQTGGIRLHCSPPQLPSDRRNLAWRAAERFFQAVGRPPDATIHLTKHIPVSAGLGGGSSDAAAVLLGLNRLWGRPLTAGALHRLATGLGADVPFFLCARPSVATGIGDRLRPCDGLRPWPVVLLNPGYAVSTAEVFRNVTLGLTNQRNHLNEMLFENHGFDIARHLHNDLEAVTCARHPDLRRLLAALRRQGAQGMLMSGSGPTVFGIFDTWPAARRAYHRLTRGPQRPPYAWLASVAA